MEKFINVVGVEKIHIFHSSTGNMRNFPPIGPERAWNPIFQRILHRRETNPATATT